MKKTTPLYKIHKNLNAEILDFGDWSMPIQYQGIIEEHNAARENVTIFDTCHMGEIFVIGEGAFETIQKLIPRDAEKFKDYHCYYTHICNENGIILDDCVIYQFNTKYYLVVINSSHYDDIYKWICSHKVENTEINNISDETGKIDIQGPKSRILLNKFFEDTKQNVDTLNFYTFQRYKWKDIKLIISRTGYTGELGFELYASKEHIADIWNTFLEKGKSLNLMPAGLGARDTLRLEAGLPLMGQDIVNLTPVEAGFKNLISKEKEDFIGRQTILNQLYSTERKHRISFYIEKGGIARTGYPILDENENTIGKVTSGTFSPTLKKAIGMGICDKKINFGQEILIKIRNKHVKGIVCQTPFVTSAGLRGK